MKKFCALVMMSLMLVGCSTTDANNDTEDNVKELQRRMGTPQTTAPKTINIFVNNEDGQANCKIKYRQDGKEMVIYSMIYSYWPNTPARINESFKGTIAKELRATLSSTLGDLEWATKEAEDTKDIEETLNPRNDNKNPKKNNPNN